MSQHDRVVVDVDDPGVRRDRLGDFMGVVRRWNPGSDVQELPDPCFAGKIAHGPGQEGPIRPHAEPQTRSGGEHAFGCLPVGGEIVFAPEPVVVDTGRMRDRRVNPADRAGLSDRGPLSRLLIGHDARLSRSP